MQYGHPVGSDLSGPPLLRNDDVLVDGRIERMPFVWLGCRSRCNVLR
ncbi:Uncharacterised protein [Vibrio cholerae]|nr:Uncharacterised protein [Vibrio cholerae]CSC48260.1 Uncharacterised protein [Vibrio cholerae]CSI53428.1 Uncharacterised protein [Vibrio cholerae]CSI82946.1 Uncharacterised protein [Vibrio cholerae]